MADNFNIVNAYARTQAPPPCTRHRQPSLSVWFSSIFSFAVGTGNTRRIFHIHHELLTFYSAYFKGIVAVILAGVRLPPLQFDKEDPAVFAVFVVWLYSRRLYPGQFSETDRTETLRSLVKLWSFAERCGIFLLMNEAIDTMKGLIAKWNRLPDTALSIIFSNATQEGALIRHFVIFAYAKLVGRDAFVTDWDAYLPGVPKPAMDIFDNPKPCKTLAEFRQINVCRFHLHNAGIRCNM